MYPLESKLENKYGIVLFNMGGPENLEEVRPFLYNLFSDEWIINLPWPLKYAQKPLAYLIAKFRSKNTKHMYSLIGGKSTSNQITQNLANLIQQHLTDEGIDNVSVIAMRYAKPRSHQAIKLLEEQEVDHLVLFTQYPHYAKSTTGSSYHDFHQALKDSSLNQIRFLSIEDWGEEEAYLKWWSNGIKNIIKEENLSIDKDLHIVFTAHGLPKKYIKNGEKYPERIEKTVITVTEKLGTIGQETTTHLCYQSRAGPFPWLQPYTDHKIKEISTLNPKSIIMVPIGFVSNNVETLYEIDILYRNLAHSLGISNYFRVNTPDADEEFAKSIALMLKRRILEN